MFFPSSKTDENGERYAVEGANLLNRLNNYESDCHVFGIHASDCIRRIDRLHRCEQLYGHYECNTV